MQLQTRATLYAPAQGAQHTLTAYADVDEVLKSREFTQAQHKESAPFVAESLIMLDGDPHFDRRRLQSSLFAKAALRDYEKSVLAPSIAASIAEATEAGTGDDGVVHIDLVPLIRRALLRITAAVTGIDGVDTPDATDRFGTYMPKLSEGTTVESSTRDHQEVIREVLALRDQFVEEFYGASVARRRALVDEYRAGRLEESELPRDLATVMILHEDPAWNADLALRETTLYLVAATHTTTNATPHVVKELTDWFAAHPEDASRIHDREFLKRASNETLRLHLPVPALMRAATTDVTLKSGRVIAAGDIVALGIDAANRDPAVFGADADVFDPWRETPPGVKPFGVAFGAGDHLCIGRALVTGMSARTGDDDSTLGTIVSIVDALFAKGMVMDPDRPPAINTAVVTDAYASFPIVLTRP